MMGFAAAWAHGCLGSGQVFRGRVLEEREVRSLLQYKPSGTIENLLSAQAASHLERLMRIGAPPEQLASVGILDRPGQR